MEQTTLDFGSAYRATSSARAYSLIGDALRRRYIFATLPERSGAEHRHADLRVPQLFTHHLTNLRSDRDIGQAVFVLITLLVGLPSEVAAIIPIGRPTTDERGRCAVWLDQSLVFVGTDYSVHLLTKAAQPPDNRCALPATPVLETPLPSEIVSGLRRLSRMHPGAAVLGDLCMCRMTAHTEDLGGSPSGGRHRQTLKRVQLGMASLALHLDSVDGSTATTADTHGASPAPIDRYHASLIAVAPELCNPARLYYIRLNPVAFIADLTRYYARLGFRQSKPLRLPPPFGSQVVPADDHVTAVFMHLGERLQSRRPAKRYTVERLIAVHNAFVVAAGYLIAFFVGLRTVKQIDLCASRTPIYPRLLDVRDKRVGEHRRTLPIHLGPVVRQQIRYLWWHLHELERRAVLIGADASTPWRRHLRRVLDRDTAALLFLIGPRGEVKPIGTSHLMRAVPADKRIVDNAGRHYWQTWFYESGLSSDDIDIWARHSPAGMPTHASTSIGCGREAAERTLRCQDAKRIALGIEPFVGLRTRSLAQEHGHD